jgi:hypothetical protein
MARDVAAELQQASKGNEARRLPGNQQEDREVPEGRSPAQEASEEDRFHRWGKLQAAEIRQAAAGTAFHAKG